MVICPRCSQPVDETTRTTCPLCFTPLPVPGADAAPPPAAPSAAPPQSYAPQPSGGVMPLAPPDAPQPAAASLNAGQTPMPTARAMPTAPANVPAAAPRMEANQRMTLSGEIIEAPQPMTNAPAAGNSQYQARPSAGAPRVAEKAARSGPALGPILLVVAALFGGGGGWWFWMHRTNPKDQAQKYFEALKTLDAKTMYQTVEVDPSQVKSEEDYMKSADAQNPAAKELARSVVSGLQFKAGDPKYNGMNEASVPVTVSGTFALPFPGQKPMEVNQKFDLPMKNFNGIWKISKDSAFAGGASGMMSKMGGQMGGKR